MSINYSTIDMRKRQAIIQLLWIGIGSICMFFAGLSSLIFVDKIQFPESPSWFLYSTIIIISSSILLIAAKGQIKKDKPVFILIFSVFVLGLFFTYSQFKGWEQLVNQEVNFAFGTKEVLNISGSKIMSVSEISSANKSILEKFFCLSL